MLPCGISVPNDIFHGTINYINVFYTINFFRKKLNDLLINSNKYIAKKSFFFVFFYSIIYAYLK